MMDTQTRYRRLRLLIVLLTAGGACVSSPAAAETFRWQDDPEAGTLTLRYGKLPVIRYMYAFDTSNKQRAHETYKVFHHVFGPGTETVITKGPHGKYTHHRGLYVGWNRTKTKDQSYDFWHCRGGVHQRHVKFLEKKADGEHGRMTALIHWNDAEGKPVIVETRAVVVTHSPRQDGSPAWQIDWSTKLESQRGDITLTGDRQHAGFQFRAAQHVAEKNNARYIRPKGFPQQPKPFQVNDRKHPDKHVNLGWLAMHFDYAGKTFTVEYMESPAMPKPSRYSERPYGRFGAFFEAKLSEDKPPLHMRYRVRVTTGDSPTQSAIQARYDTFVKQLKADGKFAR